MSFTTPLCGHTDAPWVNAATGEQHYPAGTAPSPVKPRRRRTAEEIGRSRPALAMSASEPVRQQGEQDYLSDDDRRRYLEICGIATPPPPSDTSLLPDAERKRLLKICDIDEK